MSVGDKASFHIYFMDIEIRDFLTLRARDQTRTWASRTLATTSPHTLTYLRNRILSSASYDITKR